MFVWLVLFVAAAKMPLEKAVQVAAKLEQSNFL
jgi:hypothetical protein